MTVVRLSDALRQGVSVATSDVPLLTVPAVAARWVLSFRVAGTGNVDPSAD
jgi:hypothetical protein